MTSDDLVADAAAILDALGVGRAHVAGISMAGAIAHERRGRRVESRARVVAS